MPDTSWPDGVFARYRTRGETTVDLARGNNANVEVNCLGCPYSDIVDHYSDTPAEEPTAQNERLARARAEAHAGRCRAIAPPVGE
ncbi:MAG: hypothetical protein ACRDP6_14540 [Actinoallomurus sp.]